MTWNNWQSGCLDSGQPSAMLSPDQYSTEPRSKTSLLRGLFFLSFFASKNKSIQFKSRKQKGSKSKQKIRSTYLCRLGLSFSAACHFPSSSFFFIKRHRFLLRRSLFVRGGRHGCQKGTLAPPAGLGCKGILGFTSVNKETRIFCCFPFSEIVLMESILDGLL